MTQIITSIWVGEVLWTNLSRFTMGQPEFTDNYFERLPWDWYRTSFTRYQEYYTLSSNIGARNLGRTPIQGGIGVVEYLPLQLSFKAIYGQSNRSVIFGDQGTGFPSILQGYRLEKYIFQRGIRGKAGLNMYAKRAFTNVVGEIPDNNTMISLDFDVKVIVYPEPKAGPVCEVAHNTEDAVGGKEDDRHGNEDFFALTDFIEGEPLNRVAWKQVAKTGNWVVKQFSEQKSDDVYLSLPTNTPLEEGLSALTQKIVSMQSQGLHYGLKLGSATFTPNNSISHMHQCLKALATYPNTLFDASSAKSSSHASISPAGTLAASLAAQAADNSDFQGRSK